MEQRHTYGGQAVLEGVMIRGQRHFSIAVRRPDGTIAHQSEQINLLFTGRLRRLPLIRGILVLIETLMLGMRALSYSANVGAEAEGEELGKGAMAVMMAVALTFAIGLFFLAPVFASRGLEGVLDSDIASNIAEGVIRLGLFLGYIFLISRMNDIRRVFMYHGAEHMTVHAQERGDPLELEAVRKYPNRPSSLRHGVPHDGHGSCYHHFHLRTQGPTLVAHNLSYCAYPHHRRDKLRGDTV